MHDGAPNVGTYGHPPPPLLSPRPGYLLEIMLNISRLGRGFKIRTRNPSWFSTR